MKSERDSRRALLKEAAFKRSEATKLAKKLAGPLQKLTDELGEPGIDLVSAPALKQAKDKELEAKNLESKINECIASPEASSFDPAAEKEVML